MTEALIRQQQLRRMIGRHLDNFKKLGRNNLTPAKVRARISSLKETWNAFMSGHTALSSATPEANRPTIPYFQDNHFDSTLETYETTLDYMAECLEELEPVVSHNASFSMSNAQSDVSSAFSLKHLPPIRLPPFDGNYSEWEQFRDRFTALIRDNKELTDFARMHYLSSCLKGRALECIANLPITANNFEIAWLTLKNRFESKRRALNVHLTALLNLPTVPRESATELRALYDKVNITLASLESLHRKPADLWSDILVHIVSQKLDQSTKKAWNLKDSDTDDLPSFDDLRRFLESRTRALENCAIGAHDKSVPKAAPRVHVATASEKAQAKCPLCQKPHLLSICPAFVSKNPSQRFDIVKSQKRCFNCLSAKHSAPQCQSKYSCRLCHKKHHSMLHLDSDSCSTATETPTSNCSSPHNSDVAPEVASLNASTALRRRTPVLLATAWVTVRVDSGRSVVVRALLDQGSEITFISENLAQLLRVTRIRMPTSVSAVGGIHAGIIRHAAQISISSRQSFSPSFTTTALILKSLTAYAPRSDADLSSFAHLSGLPLADDRPTSRDPIKLIIGADLYSDIIRDGIRKGGSGQPFAQNSVFGWIVSGPINSSSSDGRSPSSLNSVGRALSRLSTHHVCCTSSLDKELRQFWEVEEIPRQSILTPLEKQCEEHFCSTHARDSDGRYVVRLPFKKGPPIEIGDSHSRAVKVLHSVLRRFRDNPAVADEYREFMSEYERLGHMQRASSCQQSPEPAVYIPHHGVIRENSATTHLRVVFNASSVTSNSTSLNDHLLAGPKLQTEITSVILRWRNHRYVYCADIAKMYRQIRVDSRDINYQRILWKPSDCESPIEYQLITVTYGMACAPFLALRVIKQLVRDDGDTFPLAASVLRDNIYVDDVLFGADNLSLLRQIREQVVSLLQRGGFPLRKWASNSSSLLSDLDPADHGLACNKQLSIDEQLKILGIGWNPASDSFEFRVSLAASVPNTRRSILSAIAKLYDPLGWVAPVTVSAKILMQLLWRDESKTGWDDIIASDLFAQWGEIYSQLSHLSQLRIPRWNQVQPDARLMELHGFADASTAAYAAAVYIKVISSENIVTTTLLAGKTKVAPLKPLSVPRLELSAAILLARLITFVRESLGLVDIPCHCWTDSTIVLAWVTQHPSRWKTFVANRVTEIQSLLPHVKWRHVVTADNPADCASRGLLGNEIAHHPLWWSGPSWLRLDATQWPCSDVSPPPNVSLEEKPVTALTSNLSPAWDLATRFSSWPKLIRVTAYLLKFIRLCRLHHSCNHPRLSPCPLLLSKFSAPSSVALSAADCQAAKIFWFKTIQAETFPVEISALDSNSAISPKSPILSLSPFRDSDGILRVGGRLRNAPLPFRIRHPILLSPHPLVSLIVHQAHLRALHSGPQLTLNLLRRDFWIIRARNLVRNIIHNCVTCTRERAAIPTQFMGDLPEPRVSTSTRCFLHCGVDYAGPVQVRASPGRGITARKAYIAVFICLATKAIHLELVSDYSTSAFLNAYSRFCGRRGLPQSMYSDNGTTFVGADRELALAYRAALRDPSFLNLTASDNVEWNFIPPSAPHFGGLWESGVRSVKHHLRRVLGTHMLTFEEFSTLLCRIEACLNSRPIVPLSDTLDDYECLTPGHFLIGSALTVNPEASTLHLNENQLSRWQIVRHLTERFWKLWQSDYVNTLQQRAKWRQKKSSISIGQLALLRNNTLPPCKWELGRVTRCHPGSDGLTRVVTIKTATSEYKRPIGQLCVLPVTDQATSS